MFNFGNCFVQIWLSWGAVLKTCNAYCVVIRNFVVILWQEHMKIDKTIGIKNLTKTKLTNRHYFGHRSHSHCDLCFSYSHGVFCGGKVMTFAFHYNAACSALKS